MIKSMTGYGRGEYSATDMGFIVEIKSVNNRYRDVVLRMPRTLQSVEEDIKAQIASRVVRGRVEVFVQVDGGGGETDYTLELNAPLVKGYLDIIDSLQNDFGLRSEIRADELFKIKDVVLLKPRNLDMEKVRSGLAKALGFALDSHEAMKVKEGQAIENDLVERLERIGHRLKTIEERAPLVVEEYRNKLKEKMEQLSAEVKLDENRLVQEVAYFADRCDITEEIVRANSHLNQFRQYMAAAQAVGRRLDFLMQEINREVNTMSSKASDPLISVNTVEIKAELEKIREQIQNVE